MKTASILSCLIWPVICILLVSCAAAPPEPMYTGPLPKRPARWPSTQITCPDEPSRGWEAMYGIWETALKRSPANPAVTKELRRLIADKRTPLTFLGGCRHEAAGRAVPPQSHSYGCESLRQPLRGDGAVVFLNGTAAIRARYAVQAKCRHGLPFTNFLHVR